MNGLSENYDLGVYDGFSVCVIGGAGFYLGALACSSDTLYATTCNYLTWDCGPPGIQVNKIAKWPLNTPADTCFAVEVGIPERPSTHASFHYDPSSSTIMLDGPMGTGLLQLFDPLGRSVLSQRITRHRPVNCAHLAPGIFIAVLSDDQGLKLGTRRFMKK